MSNNKKAGIAVFCLVIFDSIRYGVGFDYINYVNAVHEQTQLFTSFMEPLSQLLMYIAHYTHYQVFFIISTFLTLYSILFFCKKYSCNPFLSIYLYFTFPSFFLSGMSIVRNALAFSMIFFAIHFLIEKKLFLSLTFCVIAFGFHSSALVAFLIYPAYYWRFNRFVSAVVILVSFFLSKYVIQVATTLFSYLPFFWKLEHYIDDIASSGSTMNYLVNGLGLLVIFFWKRIQRYQSEGSFFITLIVIGTCLWNIFQPLNSVIAERFSTYFLLPYIIVFASLSFSFKKKTNRLIVPLVSTMLFFVSFSLSISGFESGKTLKMSNLPYQTIFYHKNYSNLLMDNLYE